MAANDDFPRGWTFSSGITGAGGSPGLVVPAIAGVSHILTHAEYILENSGAGAAAGLSLEIESSAGPIFPSIGLAVVLGGVVGKDSAIYDGKIQCPNGLALIVGPVAANPAGYVSTLFIQGYDI